MSLVIVMFALPPNWPKSNELRLSEPIGLCVLLAYMVSTVGRRLPVSGLKKLFLASCTLVLSMCCILFSSLLSRSFSLSVFLSCLRMVTLMRSSCCWVLRYLSPSSSYCVMHSSRPFLNLFKSTLRLRLIGVTCSMTTYSIILLRKLSILTLGSTSLALRHSRWYLSIFMRTSVNLSWSLSSLPLQLMMESILFFYAFKKSLLVLKSNPPLSVLFS